MDLLKPNTAERVESQQVRQKHHNDLRARGRSPSVGDSVFISNYHNGPKWFPGVIEKKTGPVSYSVRLQDGRIRRGHQDQIRRRSVEVTSDRDSCEDVSVPQIESAPSTLPDPPTSDVTDSLSPGPTESSGVTESEPTPASTSSSVTDSTGPTAEPKSYPTSSRASLIRYEPTWWTFNEAQ